MKTLLFVCLVVCLPCVVHGQKLNPTVIYQKDDIYIQNTDVYYRPFMPPASTDTREGLCNVAAELRDPNGVYVTYPWDYKPMTHGHVLADYDPYSTGTPLGQYAVWMRLFYANNKNDTTTSDIIAGKSVMPDSTNGPDTISKNEDVDFRASGKIRIENGFHVMPGAFFHAYIDPKWGAGDCASAGDSGNALVFCDDFQDTAIPQWRVLEGYGAYSMGGYNCSKRENVTVVSDTGAYDGKALRVDLKRDTCSCNDKRWVDFPIVDIHGDTISSCGVIDAGPLVTYNFPLSTGTVKACPWPFRNIGDTLLWPVSPHTPYGKYEIREKIPDLRHHTNNWGNAQDGNEWNLSETYGGYMYEIHPGLSHKFIYGPYQGNFSVDGTGNIVLISSTPQFSAVNTPTLIIVDGFPYECNIYTHSNIYLKDSIGFNGGITTTQKEGGIPLSLRGHPVTFYYARATGNTTDTSLAWSVDGTGRFFTGAYRDSLGTPFSFRRGYQPNSITLWDTNVIPHVSYSYGCRWDSASGKVFLNDLLPSTRSHTGFGFSYQCDEGSAYPVPTVFIDTTGHGYHTFAMEFLPHEAHFLLDGNVVRRFPDRLIPTWHQSYDFVSKQPRAPMNLQIAEFEIGGGSGGPDSAMYADFLSKFGPGDVAHHYVDYVRITDLPEEYKVRNFPH